jgi:hypothetical protein
LFLLGFYLHHQLLELLLWESHNGFLHAYTGGANVSDPFHALLLLPQAIGKGSGLVIGKKPTVDIVIEQIPIDGTDSTPPSTITLVDVDADVSFAHGATGHAPFP